MLLRLDQIPHRRRGARVQRQHRGYLGGAREDPGIYAVFIGVISFKYLINVVITPIYLSQPNMHAAERYEGVVDKLRECNEQLEDTKEAVRELAQRFEEVKKRRLQLFQVAYEYVIVVNIDCLFT